MAQYAVSFDLDTTAVTAAGLNPASIYNTELKNALINAGFPHHPQGSLYHTDTDAPINVVMNLQNILRNQAPIFCRYVTNIHVFRMEDWSDVTDIIKIVNPVAGAAPLV